MMAKDKDKSRIASRFATDDAARQNGLEIARLCAALTKPWVLPPLAQTSRTIKDIQQLLPESYQSIGAWGTTNLVGAMHGATFPAGLPWYQFDLAPQIDFDQSIPIEDKQGWRNTLWVHQLIIQALLDSSHLDDKDNSNKRASSFYSRKHASLTQLAITGDTLEQITDDYRIKIFRRDDYTTKRDTSGDVQYHTTREEVDVITLTSKQKEMLGLKDEELREQPSYDRMKPLYTLIEWQPWTKKWSICQEVDGFEINETDELYSPYLSTPYDLAAGEHYGRGFIEQNLGDLRGLNNLEMRILDFAALCSDMKLCLDHSGCEAEDRDFQQPSGSITRGLRVTGGKVQDAAYLSVDKFPDFQVVNATVARKRADLSKAMLIESEITPSKERTTAYQVQRVQAQLQSATGGMFSSIADEQQIPLIRRLVYQCRKDKYLPVLPDKAVKISVLTGLAALAKQSRLGSILQFVDVVTRLGPELQARINPGVLLDVIKRYANIYDDGLILTEEQVQAKQQQNIANQTQLAAAQKAVDVVGNVGEAAMTRDSTGAAAA